MGAGVPRSTGPPVPRLHPLALPRPPGTRGSLAGTLRCFQPPSVERRSPHDCLSAPGGHRPGCPQSSQDTNTHTDDPACPPVTVPRRSRLVLSRMGGMTPLGPITPLPLPTTTTTTTTPSSWGSRPRGVGQGWRLCSKPPGPAQSRG